MALAEQDRNLLGLIDERRWERREEGRARRNEVRRLARKQRRSCTALGP